MVCQKYIVREIRASLRPRRSFGVRHRPPPPYNNGVYFLYSVLLAIAGIVSLPWWLWQMYRVGKYREGLGERCGRVPQRIRRGREKPVAWLHAVSVGEAVAVAPLVVALRQRGWRVVVSTTTHTGQRLAREKFGAEHVFFFPLDFAFAIRPYLRELQPRLIILAETEFWPNFLRLARRSGTHVAVVNARISDRSFPRYRRFRHLLAKVLAPIELFLAQSDQDAERLRAIGAAAARIEVVGNLKFDVAPPREPEAVAVFGQKLQACGATVIVAGSTVEGEEELVLSAFRAILKRFPQTVLVLAPRHRERFEDVARRLEKLTFRFARRSQAASRATDFDPRGAVLLLDTLGELAAVYRYATVAFVGGSLVARGGHNILEPAFFARPIVTGPHTENFRDILACFERHQAVVRTTQETLAPTLLHLLQEDDERHALGERALAVVNAQRGATARTLAKLLAMTETPSANDNGNGGARL